MLLCQCWHIASDAPQQVRVTEQVKGHMHMPCHPRLLLHLLVGDCQSLRHPRPLPHHLPFQVQIAVADRLKTYLQTYLLRIAVWKVNAHVSLSTEFQK